MWRSWGEGRGLPTIGSSHTALWEDLDMVHRTFVRPDLTTFTRLDELGLEVVAQRVEPGQASLACRVVDPDEWCHRCGCQGVARDTVIRRLVHVPFGWRPTTLLVSVRRYRCGGCGHVWRQDTSRAAEPRSRRGWRSAPRRGAMGWRWSRWTGSPGPRPPPARNSRPRQR